MDNEYKIGLGVDVDVSDIQSQINKADIKPIPIKIEIENLNDIKRQIQNLGGTKGKAKVGIPIDTASLENSLNDVSASIKDIKNSIGTLDKKSGMKSLLSSINQISTALEKASNQFAELNANMNALSGKDLSLNFGINLGGSNPIARNSAYGSKVRNETLPQLKQQVKAFEDYFSKIYKTKSANSSPLSGLLTGSSVWEKNGVDMFDLYGRMSDGTNLAKQMGAYKQYISIIKEAASLKGIDISHITSQFSKSADTLVQDAIDVQTGAKEMEESFDKLKQIFGGGNNLNIEGISQQLDSIVVDLGEIKTAIQGLSSGVSIDGLTQSFDRLSESIEKLVQNATQVKNVLGDNLDTSVSYGGTEKAIQDQKELAQVSTQSANAVVQAEERKQQAIRETTNVISDSARRSIDGVSSKGLNKYFSIDKSDSNAFKREMSNLVGQWTNNKGSLVDVKVDTKTSWDKDSQANVERLVKAQVTYNNELGETIKKTIAWRRIGTEIDSNKNESPVYGFAEISGRYSKSMGDTTTKISNFVKQQKTAVSNLTNQIEQMNRAANDQNASRPIKESGHLDTLKSKYNEITSAIQRMESASSDTFVDEQNNVKRLISEYKSLVSEYKNAENVSNKMKGTDFKSGLDIARNDLERFKAQAKGFPQITQTIRDLDKAIEGVGDSASLNNFNDQLRVARSELSKVKAEVSNVNKANTIKTNLGTTIPKEINRVKSEFKKLSVESTDLQQKLEKLDNIKIDLDTAAANNDIDGLIAANKKYEQTLKDVKAQLDIVKRAEKEKNDDKALRQNADTLSLKMDNWLNDNSAAAKKFGARIRELQSQLKSCNSVQFDGIKREFEQVQQAAKKAGKAGQTFGDQLKNQFSKYSSYLSVASLYMYVEQGLRDMFEQVKAIDSAMTELKKVTDETNESYNQFLSNAATRSREIGTTIDGLVSSTADFARLGYGFEDAQGLAEVANIYAVVGDEINGVEGATESLISTMAAFKGEMNGMSNSDFAMNIIDKFNEIGNNFAISSGGIGEALERSASSLMAANNTIDESIALITAANTVVQDPTQVGRLMPTIKVAISVKFLRRTRPRKDFII